MGVRGSMTCDPLWVVQRDSEAPPVEPEDEVFVVDEALRGVTTDRIFGLIETLYRADIDTRSGFPLYDIVKNYRVVVPSPKYTFAFAVLVYRELDAVVEKWDPDRIRCGDIQDFYAPVVRDVCDEHAVELRGTTYRGKSTSRTYLAAVAKAGAAVADTFVSAVRNVPRTPTIDADTVVLPRIDRFGTIQSVIDRLTGEVALFDTEIRGPLLPGDPYPSPDGYDCPSLHSLATPGDAAEIARFLVRDLPGDLLATDDVKSQLVATLAAEEGVTMEHTAEYMAHNLYRRAVEAKLYTVLSGRLLEASDCERVVVNGIGVPELTLIREADDDVDVYFVPHGTVSGYEQVLPGDSNRFVAGVPGKRHLAELPYIPETGSLDVTGLPKLSTYHENHYDPGISAAGEIRVLITTQPVQDDVRRQFVSTVVDCLEDADQAFTPVVKTHPDEDESFYHDVLETTRGQAQVSSDDLLGQFRKADLVVTMYSNTGIEAIAAGKPCVSVNLWRPSILEKPYISYGPIPTLKSTTEVGSFFDGLDRPTLERTAAEQIEYLREQYNLDGDPATKMAGHIEVSEPHG